MKTILAVLALMISLSAQARPGNNGQQRLEIDLGDQIFQNQSVIRLKQEIKKRHPRINFNNWDLKRVVLVAKSARGFGEASLKVGRRGSRIETVDGNRFDFRRRGHYHRVAFFAPGSDRGKWQIHMQGRIKVKKVIVVAQRKRSRRPRVTRQCSAVLETFWGKDIEKFSAKAQGPRGSGVKAKACQKAMRRCQVFQNKLPITQCRVK